jgi:uncharacterized iron-regulated membrane protein
MSTDSKSSWRLPAARKVWLNVHLWLGLTAGFVLSLTGLSGSFLVLYGPALGMEVGRHLFDVDGPPPHRAAVDQWIANAYRSYGDVGTIDFVMGPGFGHGGGNAVNLGSKDSGGKHLIVTVNPNNGVALGKFVWEDTYTAKILRFHARLSSSLAGGSEVVALLGVALIISMITGLYLWWPRNGNWYVALTFKRRAHSRRRLLDLHNLFVVYLYVPLFIIAVTGVYLIKPNWIDPIVSLASVERIPDPDALARASKPGSCNARTTPGQAVDLAQARFPSQKFALISIPREQEQPYLVRLAAPNNLHDKGQTQVYVDRECPIILTTIDGEVRIAMETFQAVSSPLHRNLMLGEFGSVIVFLTGPLLPLSFVTGLLLWLQKRKQKANL